MIDWFKKLLLKFRPYSIGVDHAIGQDYTAIVYVKELFGIFHIIKVEVDNA